MRPLPLAIALLGCESNHDFLVDRQLDASQGGDITTVVDVSVDERRVTTVFDAAQEDSSDTSDASKKEAAPPVPPLPWSLTWINGLADTTLARFCFVPVVGGIEVFDGVVPVPAAGLEFGRAFVVAEGDGGVWTSGSIHPYVVIGDAADAGDAGDSCRAIVEGSDATPTGDAALSAPYAVALPTIPPSTLALGRSYLGIVSGCARPWPFAATDVDAGDGPTDASLDADASADGSVDGSDGRDALDAVTVDVFQPPPRDAICGTATTPSLSLVRMPQPVASDAFGLQTMLANASMGVAHIEIGSDMGTGITTNPTFGQILPSSGPAELRPADLGGSLGVGVVRITGSNGDFAVSVASVLAESGLAESDIRFGDSMMLALIGARPGASVGQRFNAARFVIAESRR